MSRRRERSFPPTRLRSIEPRDPASHDKIMIFHIVSAYRGNNTGAGGHYYSTLATTKAMMEQEPVLLVYIGDFPAPALEKSGLPYVHIKAARYDPLPAIRQLSELCDRHSPRCLHGFDSSSGWVANIVGRRKGILALATKCGGEAKKLWPGPDGMPDFVFSPKDVRFYAEQGARSGRQPELVPGRVSLGEGPAKASTEAAGELAELPQREGDRRPIIMRIARFHPAYEGSFFAALKLRDALREQQRESRLIFIGYPNDAEVLQRVREACDDSVEVYTEPKYTSHAVRHLPQARIVIASGRGVMEAAAGEKIVMTASAVESLPILVDDDENFQALLDENFSQRSRPPRSLDVGRVGQLLESEEARLAYVARLKQISMQYFDIKPTIDLYLKSYQRKPALVPAMRFWFGMTFHLLVLNLRKLRRDPRWSRRA